AERGLPWLRQFHIQGQRRRHEFQYQHGQHHRHSPVADSEYLEDGKSQPHTGGMERGLHHHRDQHRCARDGSAGDRHDSRHNHADYMTTSQGSCSFDPMLRQVVCDLGTVNPGVPVTIHIIVKPRSEGTLNNTADVTADDYDPSSVTSASVNGIPALKYVDLVVGMAESADPIFAGQNE